MTTEGKTTGGSAAEPAAFVRYLPYGGIAILATLLVAWTILSSMSTSEGIAIAAGVGTMAYAGKEAGIPVGLAAGANPVTMAVFVFATDLAITLFAYPLLRFAITVWIERRGLIGAYLRHLRTAADRHRGFVLRHRTWGLLLFMLIPFAINGPLVGAVLGRLIGLRSSQILPTLIAAIAITTAGWSIVYTYGFQAAEAINPLYPKLITGAILAIVVAVGVVSILRARRANNLERGAVEPGPTA